MTDLHILYTTCTVYTIFTAAAATVIKVTTKKTFSNWQILAASTAWPLTLTIFILLLLSTAWGSLYSKLFSRKPKP